MSEFTYCLNTSTIRPTPLLDKIRIAGAAGYQAIEPWNDEVTAYLDGGGTLPDLKKALADAGLKVVSVIALHGWVTAEGDEYRQVLDDCRRRMDQAAALGQPVHRRQPAAWRSSTSAAPPSGSASCSGWDARRGSTPSMEFLGFVDGVKNVAAAWAIADGLRRAGRRPSWPTSST